jgi:hypothetical protein
LPSEMLGMLNRFMVNSQVKESMDVKIQDWNNADLLFWHQGCYLSTVNQTFHVKELRRFIDGMKHKQGELWRSLTDSSPWQCTRTFFASSVAVLTQKGICAMDYPPYSLDLGPAYFWML